MAKRFTDTDKWKKGWIRGLSSKFKLLWVYLLDDCNHAGIWDVDIDVASLRLGFSFTVEEAIKVFGDKIQVIDGGNKWFIRNFIRFQYGELNPENRAHKSVLMLLQKENIRSYKRGFRGAIQARKDKAIDKDKDKAKDKAKYLDFVLLTNQEHQKLIDSFGSQSTQAYIERLNNYIGSKGKKYKSHYHTILAWASKDTPIKKAQNYGGKL